VKNHSSKNAFDALRNATPKQPLINASEIPDLLNASQSSLSSKSQHSNESSPIQNNRSPVAENSSLIAKKSTSGFRRGALVTSALIIAVLSLWLATNTSLFDSSSLNDDSVLQGAKTDVQEQRVNSIAQQNSSPDVNAQPATENTEQSSVNSEASQASNAAAPSGDTHSASSSNRALSVSNSTKTPNADKLAAEKLTKTQSPLTANRAASATIAGVRYLDLTQVEFDEMPRDLRPEIVTHRVRLTATDGTTTDTRSIQCLIPTTDSPDVTYNGEEFVQRRALYIPVRVFATNNNSKTETITWYKPTSLLIAYLPERYRVPLMIELNLLSEVQRGCMSPADACKALPQSQSYFDMCRLDAASIRSVTVKPNPVHTVGNATIELLRTTTLSVSLYSSAGNYVTDLTARQEYGAGTHTLPLRFDGVASGLYLLTITTTKGEHVVRQIIVE